MSSRRRRRQQSVEDIASSANFTGAPRMPPPVVNFWSHSPESWFVSVEAAFSSYGVTDSAAKYFHVLRCLDGTQLESIRLKLPAPEDDDCYEVLRDLLMREYAIPLRDRVKELYSDRCRDLKPSELLKKLRNAMGALSNTPDSDCYLKETFLHHLPDHIAGILSSHVDDTVEQLALRADSIYTRASPHVVSNHYSHHQTNQLDELQRTVQSIALEVRELKAIPPARQLPAAGGQSSHNFNRSSVPRHEPFRGDRPAFRTQSNRSETRGEVTRFAHLRGTNQLCFYHDKFGDRARNCRPPCSYSSNRPFLDEGLVRDRNNFQQ